MIILQTPVRFYPYIGGVEKSVYYLSRELIKLGHRIKVICAAEPLMENGTIEGIEVERLSYLGKVANTNITLGLFKAMLNADFDIIHTHLPTPWSADISAMVSWLKDKPLFLTYYNDITGQGLNKLIATSYNISALKFLLCRSKKIFIAHKNYLKTSSFLKPFANKIMVAPLGVDLEKFRPLDLPKQDKKVIFFLSILDKAHLYKGLEYLLLSIKNIMQRIPLKLYIGGGGDLLNYYQEFVQENGLEQVVNFLGFLDDENLVNYYNLCDVFVLPSVSATQEGFGLVVPEAMACKKPVIATEIIGAADEIRKENAGIIVSPKNVQELSEAISFILLNENDSRIMGENAYRLVREKYTWENYARIIEKEYLKVAG